MITRSASPAEKIRLFRSLFRGREDVYPLRFESRRTGRAGYAPACGNEWIPGICAKPKIKCAECPNRKFLEVSDQRIRRHLTGSDEAGQPFVMGVYPMLLDETCFWVAIDLDKDEWQNDARALMETAENMGVPAALERSRSGNGAHLWCFFSEPIPATLARKLATLLLTGSMERRPDLGFASYDRIFPNQDTLPKGGFGNLIALPLQGLARKLGNTVFLDENLNAHEDQWAFLSSLGRVGRDEIENWIHEAETKGGLLGVRPVPDDDFAAAPWTAPPSRKSPKLVLPEISEPIQMILADQLYVSRHELPPPLRNRLLRLAAFQNPEFYKAQAMRLPVFNKPRIIACAEEFPEHIALPRGCLKEVISLLKAIGATYELTDKRHHGASIHVTFQGELKPDQRKAGREMLQHDIGVLSATTAFGKTVLAAWLIAQRNVNTLVLVHRKSLMDQWRERLAEFLDIDVREIGCLGGGRKKLKGRIDIALLQSLVRKDVVDDRVADYGHLVVDECHHVSARNFELAVRRAKAKYITGLTATPTRKDGHHPIIFMQCGPIRYQVDARNHSSTEALERQVIVRPTSFSPINPLSDNLRTAFVELMHQLTVDAPRNQMICDEIETAVKAGAHPLILTERTAHIQALAEVLQARKLKTCLLQGGMTRKQTQDTFERLRAEPKDSPPVLIATGKFIGEGFDHPPLDSLFLTLPISWRGTVAQYLGRLHRQYEGKTKVTVYDYADLNVPMLARMFNRRCKSYGKLGYTVLMPASALPGWPPDVPLPLNHPWKQSHAASVQRLVRDGVATPLAKLFVDTTSVHELNGTQDIHRARSAAEAFLYERLQTLPETRAHFHLNPRLPIPFQGYAHMEVDFLCREKKLVIELDGPEHFNREEAYRRDRKKDMLLQENGYRIIRFLTGDLGKELNMVLDTILRALAHTPNGK